MAWIKVDADVAMQARAEGMRARFTVDGWMIDASDSDLTSQAKEVFGDMGAFTDEMKELAERTKDDANPKPLHRNDDGSYTTNWVECECGEQYVVKSQHERSSARHKEWKSGGIGVPVPPQPLYGLYPKGIKTPRLEFGVNKICERCKAKNRKGHDYYPDPDARPENPFPCRRCNGHGVRPNIGPA